MPLVPLMSCFGFINLLRMYSTNSIIVIFAFDTAENEYGVLMV